MVGSHKPDLGLAQQLLVETSMKIPSLSPFAIRIVHVVHRCVLLFGSLLISIQLSAAADGRACTGYAGHEVSSATLGSNCEWSLTKEVDEVNVLFWAAHHGKFIRDLSQNDVVVLDDKKPPAAILGFRAEQGLPLRVGLVIDTSEDCPRVAQPLRDRLPSG